MVSLKRRQILGNALAIGILLMASCDFRIGWVGYKTNVFGSPEVVWQLCKQCLIADHGDAIGTLDDSSRAATVIIDGDAVHMTVKKGSCAAKDSCAVLEVMSDKSWDSALIMDSLLYFLEASGISYDPVGFGEVGKFGDQQKSKRPSR